MHRFRSIHLHPCGESSCVRSCGLWYRQNLVRCRCNTRAQAVLASEMLAANVSEQVKRVSWICDLHQSIIDARLSSHQFLLLHGATVSSFTAERARPVVARPRDRERYRVGTAQPTHKGREHALMSGRASLMVTAWGGVFPTVSYATLHANYDSESVYRIPWSSSV